MYDTAPAPNRRPLFFFALILVLGSAALYFTARPQPSVDKQIAAAFEKAQVAAQRGDIAGATEIVSADFHAGSLTKQRLKLLLFRARAQERGTDWRVEITQPLVYPTDDSAPDKRLVITRVSAKDASGETLWSTGTAPVTLLMREEKTRVFWVFPGTAWRVVSAPGLPVDTGGDL